MNPSTPPSDDRRARAEAKVAERRARVRRIRHVTAAGSAAAFIAVFGGLYGQMSAGGDPALGSGSTAAESTTTETTTDTQPAESTASSTEVTPVTTGQS